MGTVPPRIIPPLSRGASLEVMPVQKKLPLRKCMQCHALKRERFSCRCQACYDANEEHYRAQKAAGVRWPVNENIIGWTVCDTLPGVNDYVRYFVRWLWKRWTGEKIVIPHPQGQSNTALLALMKAIEREQAGEDEILLVSYEGLEKM